MADEKTRPMPAQDMDELNDLEAEGVHQGLGRRARKPPSDREHGVKTRRQFKDIVSRRT